MTSSARSDGPLAAGAALWRPLPWQQALWLELTAQILQHRLGHALLLSGPAGVGKRWFARALGAFLLCEQRSGFACGTCRSCQQLAVGAHPNASVLSPDGLCGLAVTASGQHAQGLVHWQPDAERKRRDIPIDAARKLIAQLGLSAHYGGVRVAFVDPADALNSNSVNALLKTIEEPPPATHLLLVGERPQALPATLRSRCQRIRFATPRAADAVAWLAADGVTEPAEALQAAHGAPLRALEITRDGELALHREWAELWTAVARRRKDPVSAAATVDREAVAAHLQWAWSWLHDRFRVAAAHGSLDADTASAWAQVLDEVVESNRQAARNAQPQMLLESLFVQWMRLGRGLLGESR